ncbi:cytochrome c oxidase assembly protein [Aurantimonas sp. 22II-16-19i]|uniref:cytochrome c oxidase assembly protein n=1 Tax=Aurantimonas sp. 22II-16-19i TaxID=1317114 RepID=UPI0009F7D005|nr:cytochrome c oxidase assembly protein [Aurantimonas sp. 22II-16-19i]ORE98914.1 signal peptide protein [Aurantimonas sp. 22II-16-19i]
MPLSPAPGRADTEAEAAPGGSPLSLWPLALGLVVLAGLWLGPLPQRAQGSFAAHMVMHMGVVAVAAPLLAIGLLRLWPRAFSQVTPALAILASFAEFAVVWTWHAPALHDAARASFPLLLVEQACFIGAGLFVWITAIGTATAGDGKSVGGRAAGTLALLVTSMHMTLLGALLLLSPRPLYACADLCSPAASFTPLGDQQAGGVVMLIVGGASYLAGGLALLATVLKERAPAGGDNAEAIP